MSPIKWSYSQVAELNIYSSTYLMYRIENKLQDMAKEKTDIAGRLSYRSRLLNGGQRFETKRIQFAWASLAPCY